jgi:two-component system, LytTR family, response regulator LytT
VASADNGEEAINMAMKHKPDLALMDIMIKGDMNGIAAAEEIKRNMDIPVVFLTAYADESTLSEAKLAEPHGYILKPFKDVDIQTAIEMAMGKSKSFDKKQTFCEAWLSIKRSQTSFLSKTEAG